MPVSLSDLLARGGEEEERALRPPPGADDLLDRRELRDGEALHVVHAAAVDPGAVDGGAERRVAPPLLRGGRLDVDVIVQDDRAALLALDEGPEVGAAPAHPLDRRGDAERAQTGGQELGARHLVGIGVAGVDAHVLLERPHLGQGLEVDALPEALLGLDPFGLPVAGDRPGEPGEREGREQRGDETAPEREPGARAQRARDRRVGGAAMAGGTVAPERGSAARSGAAALGSHRGARGGTTRGDVGAGGARPPGPRRARRDGAARRLPRRRALRLRRSRRLPARRQLDPPRLRAEPRRGRGPRLRRRSRGPRLDRAALDAAARARRAAARLALRLGQARGPRRARGRGRALVRAGAPARARRGTRERGRAAGGGDRLARLVGGLGHGSVAVHRARHRRARPSRRGARPAGAAGALAAALRARRARPAGGPAAAAARARRPRPRRRARRRRRARPGAAALAAAGRRRARRRAGRRRGRLGPLPPLGLAAAHDLRRQERWRAALGAGSHLPQGRREPALPRPAGRAAARRRGRDRARAPRGFAARHRAAAAALDLRAAGGERAALLGPMGSGRQLRTLLLPGPARARAARAASRSSGCRPAGGVSRSAAGPGRWAPPRSRRCSRCRPRPVSSTPAGCTCRRAPTSTTATSRLARWVVERLPPEARLAVCDVGALAGSRPTRSSISPASSRPRWRAR